MLHLSQNPFDFRHRFFPQACLCVFSFLIFYLLIYLAGNQGLTVQPFNWRKLKRENILHRNRFV